MSRDQIYQLRSVFERVERLRTLLRDGRDAEGNLCNYALATIIFDDSLRELGRLVTRDLLDALDATLAAPESPAPDRAP